MTRREVFRRGSLGAATLALGGATPCADSAPTEAVILVLMIGGPSQLETFDPKPDAPLEVRGPCRSIATAVPGVRLGEGLPGLAQRMDRVALIRSLHHDAAPIHETGLQLLQTGRLAPLAPAPPHLGELIDSPKGTAWAVLPRPIGSTGVRITRGQDAAPLAAVAAQSSFEANCKQAVHLVRQGTRLVVINQFETVFGGLSWDAHGRAPFATLDDVSRRVLPEFDHSICSLLDDLASDGRLERTLVVAVGEFGRTPQLNANGGRDHWTRAFSGLVAGGGMPGGAVIGTTDSYAGEVVSEPVPLADLAAMMGHALGLGTRPGSSLDALLSA